MIKKYFVCTAYDPEHLEVVLNSCLAAGRCVGHIFMQPSTVNYKFVVVAWEVENA
jgi:hypothetical protein